MTVINSRAFGPIDNERQQKEYMLALAAVDCAIRNQSAWVADVMIWFDASCILDPYLRSIFERVLQLQESGEPVVPYKIAQGVQQCGRPYGVSLRIATLPDQPTGRQFFWR